MSNQFKLGAFQPELRVPWLSAVVCKTSSLICSFAPSVDAALRVRHSYCVGPGPVAQEPPGRTYSDLLAADATALWQKWALGGPLSPRLPPRALVTLLPPYSASPDVNGVAVKTLLLHDGQRSHKQTTVVPPCTFSINGPGLGPSCRDGLDKLDRLIFQPGLW